MHDYHHLEKIAKTVRRLILDATTQAGSGHPTSALSAVELMVGLMFNNHFRYDVTRPEYPNNDRLIFSKGHASPLYYALWVAAGAITREDLLTYRQFDSRLEGHPTARFLYTDAATGSLGQGLSIGVGMALNATYLGAFDYRTWVLLGDSEMSEGSQWEAMQLAAHYRLDNLIGVLDVNRLGQRGETMFGYDLRDYRARAEAFGWSTLIIDGHDLHDVLAAYEWAVTQREMPCMIIAKTVKGKGVSFLEDRDGLHGKALTEEEREKAVRELGDIDFEVRGTFAPPLALRDESATLSDTEPTAYAPGDEVATRDAYGNALARIAPAHPDLVALDGEVCNSTRAQTFRDAYPRRFFEMYVAEQNMVGAAIGLARHGRKPFVSTFAAFFTRAFDQIRMAVHSNAHIRFVGSHAGVSIGPDGPSQMGLEDIAMFRTLPGAAVLYPCDAVSTEKLVEEMAQFEGIAYLRTTRGNTPVIYDTDEEFPIGGCKVLAQSENDRLVIVAAGITVREALGAHKALRERERPVRVIDCYSVKPIDREALRAAAMNAEAVLTVEDHYPEGGIGEAVAAALAEDAIPVFSLAVRRIPRSGTSRELLDFEEISADAIARRAEQILDGAGS